MGNISKFGDFDGFELGVFSDGTPFASSAGLGALCGVDPVTIRDIGEYVAYDQDKFRAGKIASLLSQYGFTGERLYEKLLYSGTDPKYKNQYINVYPEPVCMAILEYYAYEAGRRCTEKAKEVARILMRKSFKDFVYALVGYKDTQSISFNSYVLSRIIHHHNVDEMPLPDGYFCLFDKMIEILQKFDLKIDYELRDRWFDVSKGDERFLEPDISLGRRFVQLFTSDYVEKQNGYDKLYQERLSQKPKKKFWTQKLIDAKWELDKSLAERDLRIEFVEIEGVDSSLPIPEELIPRKRYRFNPSPDSNRKPEYVKPAFCYPNDYTSLFYRWLKDVFFKFVWRDYILERDPEGWMQKYNMFKSLPIEKQNSILQTSEGQMISGFEYREIWERQLPPSPDQ